jgi:hypothetical protein
MAIVAGSCSADLSKLRRSTSSASDGATDFPVVSDVAWTGGGPADSDEDATGTVSMLDSPALPIVDAADVPDDANDSLEALAMEDATVPDDTADSSDVAASGDDTGGTPPDSGGGGGAGGSSGTGGVDANGSGGGSGTGGVDADGSGGSSGTGGVDADGSGGSGGSGGLDANGSGGAGDAGIDSGEGSGTDGGNYDTDAAGGFGGTGGEDPDLVIWYKFDESDGPIAADSSPSCGGTRAGTLGTAGTGTAIFSTDCQVGTHALSLVSPSRASTPAGGYVTVPAPEALAPGALTIAIWIKLAAATSNENWERVFDFGSGSSANAYFYLTARASDAANIPLRFGISNTGHTTAAEQRIESPSTLAANVWHHIAIVLPAGATYTGALYLDGVVVATNKAMTLHLSDVGTTTLNWLGRSPFTADPFFNGSLDDLRIYKRALSKTEIAALFLLR